MAIFRRALAAIALASPLAALAGSPDAAEVADRLLASALASGEAYDELRELCDTIGHRLSGSPQLAKAEAWAADRMRQDGLAVTLEPVEVPVWKRGSGRGRLLSPVEDDLAVLALGGSVPTPPGGVVAEVVVVSSFDELEARADEVAGKVVVFDAPFTSYGETVRYRYAAASAASRHGAQAALVRSVSPISLYTPHTGQQAYAEDVRPIPVAAITLEDAERMHRQADAGQAIRVQLQLSSGDAGTATAHNVVGELKGRDRPDEIVVLGCHLDSWDVGQGAQDDGAGCVTVMEAVAQLAALPEPPRRTVRAVLYTNEENGLAGALAYAEAHADEAIVAAVEDDSGSGAPLGFRVDVRDDTGATDADGQRRVMRALDPYTGWLAGAGDDATIVSPGGSGADVGQLVKTGRTVGFGLAHEMAGYWPIHHTEADTFDKVDPALVKRNVAALTVFSWILAETDAIPTP